jgi:hypothetical protein
MSTNEHDARLEEAVAFALGSLDPERIEDFKAHLATCDRCQQELRWLAPAVRALPEAVDAQAPPPELKVRLMADVREDLAAERQQARAEQRRERPSTGGGFGQWLSGLRLGGLTWKPMAGLAAALLVVAVGIGYAVGSGGGPGAHTTEIEPGPNGIEAKVIREGDKGELHLADVKQLPKGKVLEAWVKRGNAVEPVEALFTPDHAGNAATTIENMEGVEAVLVTREPQGGTKVPTSEPIVTVPLES